MATNDSKTAANQKEMVWMGPVESMTLTAAGDTQKVVFSQTLHPGKPVTVPVDHPIIKQLIAAKLLQKPTAKTSKGDA